MENQNNTKKIYKNKRTKVGKKTKPTYFDIPKNPEEIFNPTYLIGDREEINEKLQKYLEKQQKIEKKRQKREFNKILSEDKLSKNVIYYREKAVKQNENKNKINSKRIKRSNKYLLKKEDEIRDIYLTIDRFNNNGKKTIVYFIDSFFPMIDGVVAVLDNYAKQMQKYYNVVVCAPKHKNQEYEMSDYFVLYSDSMFIKSQGYDLAFPQVDAIFQKYISLLKIDLIHLQSPFNMGTYGLGLAKRRKIPCLISFHSQFKQNFYNAVKNDVISTWLTKILMVNYQKSNLAITMNDFAKKVMREYGVTKNIEIVPNATNLKEKEFDKEFENYVISKHKINKNIFNLIFIGRFVEVKNVYFILETIKELYKINKKFNFIFLGFGPEQGKMQKICQENGLNNVVKFTGKIDDVDEKAVLIKNSDLLFFPSVYDTDGIVKIECACYSVPTLCIEDTGVAANMINDVNGFICENDKMAFVEKLDYLIKNVDFVKKVGENAKRDIYLTWEDVCERLKKIYDKYLNSYTLQYSKNNKNKTTKKRKIKSKTLV